jgi:hypothetical protein
MFRIKVVVINEINISCFLRRERGLMRSPFSTSDPADRRRLGRLYTTTLTVAILYSVE